MIRIFQLHKRASYRFENIQDKFGVSPDGRAIALADGTTQSFNSARWAAQLCEAFTRSPNLDPAELIASFSPEAEAFKSGDYSFSANPALASLERTHMRKGGTATFLGCVMTAPHKFRIIGCGDSMAFLGHKGKVTPLPFKDIAALDANTQFLNTEQLVLGKVNASSFFVQDGHLKESDTLVLTTDALGRLILNNRSALEDLLRIESFEAFYQFCIRNWDNKTMQEDDITAIILQQPKKKQIKTLLPQPDFSFPEEQKPAFTPTPTQPHTEGITMMELDQFRRRFDDLGVMLRNNRALLQANRKLLVVVIALTCVNLATSVISCRHDPAPKTASKNGNSSQGFGAWFFGLFAGDKPAAAQTGTEAQQGNETTPSSPAKDESGDEKHPKKRHEPSESADASASAAEDEAAKLLEERQNKTVVATDNHGDVTTNNHNPEQSDQDKEDTASEK